MIMLLSMVMYIYCNVFSEHLYGVSFPGHPLTYLYSMKSSFVGLRAMPGEEAKGTTLIMLVIIIVMMSCLVGEMIVYFL